MCFDESYSLIAWSFHHNQPIGIFLAIHYDMKRNLCECSGQDWSLGVELSMSTPISQSSYQNPVNINEVYDISLYSFSEYKCYVHHQQVTTHHSHTKGNYIAIQNVVVYIMTWVYWLLTV